MDMVDVICNRKRPSLWVHVGEEGRPFATLFHEGYAFMCVREGFWLQNLLGKDVSISQLCSVLRSQSMFFWDFVKLIIYPFN